MPGKLYRHRQWPSGCHFPIPALDHEPVHQESRKQAGLLLPCGHTLSRAADPEAEVSPPPARAVSGPAWWPPTAHRGAGSADGLWRQPEESPHARADVVGFRGRSDPFPNKSVWKRLVEESLNDCAASEPRAVNYLERSHLRLFRANTGSSRRLLAGSYGSQLCKPTHFFRTRLRTGRCERAPCATGPFSDTAGCLLCRYRPF